MDRLPAGEQQPASALLAIRLLIGVAPALLLGISMIVAWKSPLGRREHAALRKKLERRRAAMGTRSGPATPGRP